MRAIGRGTPIVSRNGMATRSVGRGMPVDGGASVAGRRTGSGTLPITRGDGIVASAGGWTPRFAVVSLPVGRAGSKATAGTDDLRGALISSDATGFIADGCGFLRLLISAASSATEGGRRAVRLFVLPAMPGGEIEEVASCPSATTSTGRLA